MFVNPFSPHFLVDESDCYRVGLGEESQIVLLNDFVASHAENLMIWTLSLLCLVFLEVAGFYEYLQEHMAGLSGQN